MGSLMERLTGWAKGVAEEQAARDGKKEDVVENAPPVLQEVVEPEGVRSAEVVELRPGPPVMEAALHEEVGKTVEDVEEPVQVEGVADAVLLTEQVEPAPVVEEAAPPAVVTSTALVIHRPGTEPTIEAEADELLAHMGELTFPMDYRMLVESLHLSLGLFDPVNKENLRNVSSAYVPVSRHIWINTRDPEPRRRFAAAHMLGKAINDPRQRAMSFRDTVMSPSLEDIIPNRFAMAILMPETHFVSAFDDLEGDVDRLAEKFGVPRQVVRQRIQSLRLRRIEADDTDIESVCAVMETLAPPAGEEQEGESLHGSL